MKPRWHEFAVDTISRSSESMSPECYQSILFIEHASVLCKALGWCGWALSLEKDRGRKMGRYVYSVKEGYIDIFCQRSRLAHPV